MGLADAGGLVGVGLMTGAYAAAAAGLADPKRPPALLANLIGALLVMYSLTHRFNLSAMVMEAVWALVALAGLLRFVLVRRG